MQIDGFKVVIAFFITIGALLFGFKEYYDMGIQKARMDAAHEESVRLTNLYNQELQRANTRLDNIVMKPVDSMPVFIASSSVLGYPYGEGYVNGYNNGYNDALSEAGLLKSGRFQFMPE